MGNTGVQMTGWFRKPIEKIEDFKGLKMRIPGLAGKVYAALGVDVKLLPGGEIFPALERGVIDAAEFVGPYQDRRLGLHKAAKFYHTTGWHETSTVTELIINKKAWDSLPADLKEIVRVAAAACNVISQSWCEQTNAEALDDLIKNHGVQARPLPPEVIAKLKEITVQTLNEAAKKRAAYTRKRGLGGFVRATWDEVTEIIAAANAYTVKTYGPDRVIGFSPIPAMSMVSYAAGSRYLSLLGGVCMSFYDWYCDLPPASPADLGRADRRAGKRRLVQFRLPDPVGLERPADAHARRALLHRGALQGRQERRHLPRLFGSLQVRRPVDLGEAGHRRGARHGDGPRHPARVLSRPAGRVFRGLRRGNTPTCRCWCGW